MDDASGTFAAGGTDFVLSHDGLCEAQAHDPLSIDGAAWTLERKVTRNEVEAILEDSKLSVVWIVLKTSANKRRVATGCPAENMLIATYTFKDTRYYTLFRKNTRFCFLA